MAKPDTAEHLTSSRTGTFYLAFGSNLSAHQMSLRLTNSPSSSIPIALARLDGYAWIICERGYANIVALPGPSTASTHETAVWGIIYNMAPADEAVLDRYEGHDNWRNPHPVANTDPATRHIKPFEQGNWDYNKHYLPVTVTQWFRDPTAFGLPASPTPTPSSSTTTTTNPDPTPTTTTTITVLAYVDEYRTQPGRINREYIGRMNRAIDESVALGLPEAWVDAVLRKFIPPGIGVDHAGYVGTDKGFVEAEATEAYDDITERQVRAWRKEREARRNDGVS